VLGNPSRILVTTPMIEGGNTYDPAPFDSKAVILRIDNSVSSVRIDDSGKGVIKGADVLDSTASEYWGTTTVTPVFPDI